MILYWFHSKKKFYLFCVSIYFDANDPREFDKLKFTNSVLRLCPLGPQKEEEKDPLIQSVKAVLVSLSCATSQQGVEFSQYSLGLIYSGADSTLKDWQKAHMWVSIAYHNGHIRSKNILQQLQLHLTTEQLLEAGKNANRCIFSDYQDCGWPE